MKVLDVYIGFDSREPEPYRVCAQSVVRRSKECVVTHPLRLNDLRRERKFFRTTEPGNDDKAVIDSFDRRPLSTEFAFSRFLVPHLHDDGWALFCDPDILFLEDVAEVFALADPQYAVMCVKHDHAPPETKKMDGVPQTRYPRKNWSSFVLWNCSHPAHNILKAGAPNVWTGRQLHTFSWLTDEQIGSLPPEWNWIEGSSDPGLLPKAVHYTAGGPWFPECRGVKYADLWNYENNRGTDLQRDYEWRRRHETNKMASAR